MFIDESLNVIYPIGGTKDNPLVVCTAHQDVVFPDTTTLAVTVTDGKIMAHAGSTDCNIPLSLGIPSVCLGCYNGGKAHTYEEWVEIASLEPGYRVAFKMVLSYFQEKQEL
ncbi:hypothetical protein [uncultured Sphaerochaeta sp.]|uniref:hypothetical protein n=1 Tax=uncultured Sphaerochaeta sp. TaxID=886478 RepID=UPI002A0A34A3|nr:hypothetical protein [uncultured Sphaerochaeta sp.]